MGNRGRKNKVSRRLGYNARGKVWVGKKKKWRRKGRFQEAKGPKTHQAQPRNPRHRVTNPERKEERKIKVQRGKKPIRRKDGYRNELKVKKGRQRRYGGIRRSSRRKPRKEERKGRQRVEQRRNRRLRKGRSPEGRERKHETSRRSQVERRADRRRRRGGRVRSVQEARDYIEHGKVWRRTEGEEGRKEERVKEKGKVVNPGQGRKREEGRWRKRKGQREELRGEEGKGEGRREYRGVGYREVDYQTGRRWVYRKPYSGERVVPKGRKRTRKDRRG